MTKTKVLLLGSVVTALLGSSPALAQQARVSRTVASGETLVIDKTTQFDDLTLAPGAKLTAPQGRVLTMVVNTMETSIAPGHYTGNVTLVPSDDIVVNFKDMGANKVDHFRAAVYVEDGRYSPAKSVREASIARKPLPVSHTGVQSLVINSQGESFNGIIVTGKSQFSIADTVINLVGNGRNDFDGLGAGIKVDGQSDVTVDRAIIHNKGVVRTAIWVGGHSNATINDSYIEVGDGTLPDDYSYSWVTPRQSKDVMLEVPWLLGLRGNNRATLVEEDATITFNRSYIRAEGWGALSSDDPKGGIFINANDCFVEVLKSGYGSYTVGNTLATFNHTHFEVPDYGVIMASGAAVFTNNSTVNSRRFGAMAHGGASGALTIDKGSVFNTGRAVIQLKNSSPDIVVDGATLNSANGIILEAIPDDNPHRSHDGGGQAPPANSPVKVGPYNSPHPTKDINARFSNVTLAGDFLNALTDQSGLDLHFANAKISGAITTARYTPATGPNGEKLVLQDKNDLYYLIGEGTKTAVQTQDAHGVSVELDAASTWEVTKTSYISRLNLAPGAKLVAPAGRRLEITVDGKKVKPSSGSIEGKIVLKPV